VRQPLAETWFENPVQGQRFRLITLPSATGGRGFTLEYQYRPYTGETAVPAHFHPTATETFEVLAGHARYRLGTAKGTLGPSERIVMASGIPHVHPWSVSGETLHVRQTTEVSPPDPAGLWASLQALVTLFGLAAAGKVNRRGLPNPLQLAVAIRSTMPATYLAGLPRVAQHLLFGSLAQVGRAVGYKTAYPQYGVLSADGLERTRTTV
jgi:hypothetical protein